jgi:hypothetical protein
MGALRTIAVWLLMLVASGTIPVAALCVERASDCGEMCARCWCRQRSSDHNVRARCPCCEPQDDAAVITLLPPAVIPASTPSLCPPPSRPAPGIVRSGAGPVTPSIPDPPPRVRLLF